MMVQRGMARGIVGLALLAVACRAAAPRAGVAPASSADPTAAARAPVGITSRVYEDHARDRRLPVTIWYPAQIGTAEETTTLARRAL